MHCTAWRLQPQGGLTGASPCGHLRQGWASGDGRPSPTATRARRSRRVWLFLLVAVACTAISLTAAPGLPAHGKAFTGQRSPTTCHGRRQVAVAQSLRDGGGGGGAAAGLEEDEGEAAAAEGEGSRADEYQWLSQRDHVLRRPDMYIGPTGLRRQRTWVFSEEEDRLRRRLVRVSPGLLHIFNEILLNAIDRQFDSSWGKNMSRIDIRVRHSDIVIESDGGPIPVEVHEETGLYVPTLVFGEFHSGNNFDDEKVRFVGGRNGVGAKATNAFSEVFEVEVKDPVNRKHFRQRWEQNMAKRHDPVITDLGEGVSQGSVKVTFRPELARFGLRVLSNDHRAVLAARAYDAAACTREDISIRFNRKKLKVRNFHDFAHQVVGPGEIAFHQIEDGVGMVRAEIAVAFSKSGFQSLGLVNGIRCNDGTHIDAFVNELVRGVISTLPVNRREEVRPNWVRSMLCLVVRVVVGNPDFSSQMKTALTTPAEDFGFDAALPGSFRLRVAGLGPARELRRRLQIRERQPEPAPGSWLSSATRAEDAEKAGSPGAECTLILAEGTAGRALALAGLSEVGREYFGVLTLGGKLPNARGARLSRLMGEKDIRGIVEALGLEWGRSYDDAAAAARALRYRRVMIFSDQDLDGHHSAGWIINLFHSRWPSLLRVWPDFIQRFSTPIVKVFPNQGGHAAAAVEEFFTQRNFKAWRDGRPHGWQKHYREKYYNGLGTSTRKEAVGYFSDLDRHVLPLKYDPEGGDDEALQLAFAPGRSEDRIRWLSSYDPSVELDYLRDEASVSDFLEQQLVHFIARNTRRTEKSLPLLMDGLKPTQRKALHAVRSGGGATGGERKVSELAASVWAETNYPSGEEPPESVIVGLAQDFAGTNNVNLLAPQGMFGTRLRGPSARGGQPSARRARQLYSGLAPLASKVFRPEDDSLLTLQIEGGQEVEPRQFLPVVPLVLINSCGSDFHSTSWSGPNYHPLEVSAALARLIRGEEEASAAPLLPWYDKWHGRIYEEEGGSLYSEGKWRLYRSDKNEAAAMEGDLTNADGVEITELPLGVWTDRYILDLEANFLVGELTIQKCSDHDDQNVHLIVISDGLRPYLDGEDPHEAVGVALMLRMPLQRKVKFLHAEDPDEEPTLTHFSGPEEVLEAFHRARRPFYGLRRDRQLRGLRRAVAVAGNRLRFVQAIISGSLKLGNLDLQKVEEALEEAGFDHLGDGEDQGDDYLAGRDFDYLLQLPLSCQTRECAEELEWELGRLEAELHVLMQTSADGLWLADIAEFETAYAQEQEAKERERKLQEKEAEERRRKRQEEQEAKERKRMLQEQQVKERKQELREAEERKLKLQEEQQAEERKQKLQEQRLKERIKKFQEEQAEELKQKFQEEQRLKKLIKKFQDPHSEKLERRLAEMEAKFEGRLSKLEAVAEKLAGLAMKIEESQEQRSKST